MVVFGRPKGDRGSYKQWEEENIAPQVVFEILSPSNDRFEMSRNLLFFERHKIEEYYLYDPENIFLDIPISKLSQVASNSTNLTVQNFTHTLRLINY